MEYMNELVFSESRSLNMLAYDITLVNIQALRSSNLNSAKITNDLSNIGVNPSKTLML
jgi:hypothetical protein